VTDIRRAGAFFVAMKVLLVMVQHDLFSQVFRRSYSVSAD